MGRRGRTCRDQRRRHQCLAIAVRRSKLFTIGQPQRYVKRPTICTYSFKSCVGRCAGELFGSLCGVLALSTIIGASSATTPSPWVPAKELDLLDAPLGVIIIGHRAPREEREDLIRHFRSTVHFSGWLTPSVETICRWHRLPSQPTDRGVSSAAMGVILQRPPSQLSGTRLRALPAHTRG